MKTRTFIGPDFFLFATMKLALGLDVQANAKGGKLMSVEDSHQGALVRKVDAQALCNFQDDGAKRVGMRFASNTDLELWTEEVEQGVIDNMIIFQKPFPGAARTELQRAVKVSAKGKHVKRKIDLERCLFWDPAGNCAPHPAEFSGSVASGPNRMHLSVAHATSIPCIRRPEETEITKHLDRHLVQTECT